MLRKRCIIETINDMLKNTAQLVHSRHKSVNNFIMSIISSLLADYCFFDNKPQALKGYHIRNTKQLLLFLAHLIPNWRIQKQTLLHDYNDSNTRQ